MEIIWAGLDRSISLTGEKLPPGYPFFARLFFWVLLSEGNPSLRHLVNFRLGPLLLPSARLRTARTKVLSTYLMIAHRQIFALVLSSDNASAKTRKANGERAKQTNPPRSGAKQTPTIDEEQDLGVRDLEI